MPGQQIRAARSLARSAIVLSLFLLLLPSSAAPAAGFQPVVVDSTGDVGRSASLRLDSQGNPHIVYIDETLGTPAYAHRSGSTWIIEKPYPSTLPPGQFCSFDLDSQDLPHIVFGTADSLTYAYKATPSPGSWTSYWVDGAGAATPYPSLELDSLDRPHVVYGTGYPDPTGYLRYATFTIDPWSWTIETIEASDSIGRTSIRLVSDEARIAYVDYTDAQIWYRERNAGVWSAPVDTVDVIGLIDPFQAPLFPVELQFDSAQNMHVGYVQVSFTKVAHYRDSTWGWLVTTGGGQGAHVSFAIDGLGYDRLAWTRKLSTGTYVLRSSRDVSQDTLAVLPAGTSSPEYLSLTDDGVGNPRLAYYDPDGANLMYVDEVGSSVAAGTVSGTSAGVWLGRPDPNPFTQSTRIRYYLPVGGTVRIQVFDVGGRLVRILDSTHREAGHHEIRWDGRDGMGAPAVPAVYFIRLETAGFSVARKIVRIL